MYLIHTVSNINDDFETFNDHKRSWWQKMIINRHQSTNKSVLLTDTYVHDTNFRIKFLWMLKINVVKSFPNSKWNILLWYDFQSADTYDKVLTFQKSIVERLPSKSFQFLFLICIARRQLMRITVDEWNLKWNKLNEN